MPRTLACFALLLALLVAPAARSQETGNSNRHSLRSGAWALEFGVQPTFTSGFSGSAALSIKRHLSNNLGLRVGTKFLLSEGQSEVESYGAFIFPPESGAKYDRDSSDYTVFVHLQPFLSVRDRTAIYLYGGPYARWVNLDADYRWLESNMVDHGFTIDYGAWYAGLELGAGFEWFWSRSLSLGAYYGIAGQYGEYDREDINYQGQPVVQSVRSESGKSFDLDTSSSFFRLAAYF